MTLFRTFIILFKFYLELIVQIVLVPEIMRDSSEVDLGTQITIWSFLQSVKTRTLKLTNLYIKILLSVTNKHTILIEHLKRHRYEFMEKLYGWFVLTKCAYKPCGTVKFSCRSVTWRLSRLLLDLKFTSKFTLNFFLKYS